MAIAPALSPSLVFRKLNLLGDVPEDLDYFEFGCPYYGAYPQGHRCKTCREDPCYIRDRFFEPEDRTPSAES